jgi:hypothetical protein
MPTLSSDRSPPGAAQAARSIAGWRSAALLAAAYWYLTSSVVFIGAWLGVYVVPSAHSWRGYAESLVYVGGNSYYELVDRGYGGDPKVATRFPAYFMLAWGLKQATGVGTAVALVATANACLLAAMVLLLRSGARRPGSGREAIGPNWALLCSCPWGSFRIRSS